MGATMRELMALFTFIHFASLLALCLYGLHRLWLVRCLYLHNGKVWTPPSFTASERFPKVTVQLPLYNERFVVKRLLDAAAGLDWPRDRLEIQVLDDSDDDTRGLVDERAAWWRRQGVGISVVRRADRRGYKAGALANGLATAHGEFIAIFDADFIPPADFLRTTVPWFRDHGVG